MAALKPHIKYITMADNPRGDVMACPFRCDELAWVELQKMGLWQFIVIGVRHGESEKKTRQKKA